ncbi:MAG: hypothetical protein JWR63_2937 [Conexibacter sp.]|nr:hypothetical protein [Conexibacter sp.]
MAKSIRIGSWAAFWGDTRSAAAQILREDDIDYLVSDYLSEITMALLARAKVKDPDGGYVKDAVAVLKPLLPEISRRGIKVVTNAGALNPTACARALEEAAQAMGVELTVAAIVGDDVMPHLDALVAAGQTDMFTGRALPGTAMTMNAYLGARPIAAALDAGADIVVTGRCVDSATALGPLLHEFGWGDEDHDLLSAGSLIGHIIECGPQCCGGTFTDWESVPGWDDMGFPIAECHDDGTAIITKPGGTGGLVTPATVSEQILYEIGDPGAYLMPDVTCDWREVRLRQDGANRVHVSGAKGGAAPPTYKVTATVASGYRSMTTAMFAGLEAAAKARRVGEALITRTARLIAEAGYGPFDETSVEVIGAGDTYGPDRRHDAATEAVVKIGVRHADKAALEIFALEYAPMALVAQGMSGFFAGRPRVAPVIEVVHLLVDKATLPVSFQVGDDRTAVAVVPGAVRPVGTPTLPDGPPAAPAAGRTVPLRRLAYGRSGDKGDQANIGIIARRPEFTAVIQEQVTAARVAAFFAQYLTGGVRRWELPGLHALNFLLDGVLGGAGGTSTLRYDPQAKTYAAMLLELPIVVPAEWDASGLLLSAPAAGTAVLA